MANQITPKREETNGEHSPGVFESLTGLRDDMNHMFDQFFKGAQVYTPSLFQSYEPAWLLGRGFGAVTFAVDIHEDDTAITLTAELPGLGEDDIELVLRDDMLVVKGEKKTEHEEKKDNYFLSERRYGAFERSFRMPDNADFDNIAAQFDKGVLTVTVPRKAAAKKAGKKIKVEAK